jgi:hypothetical protein
MAAADSAKETAKEVLKNVPPSAKNVKSDDDGDEKLGPQPGVKQKFLPTGLSRAIVLAAVIASFAIAAGSLFGDRYDLVPAPNSANSFMYRIDKLTGHVQFCGPQGCADVPQMEK